MILSALEEKDRPFVRIQWAARPGEPKRKIKTNIRKDDPDKERKIQIAINQLQTKLLQGGLVEDRPNDHAPSAGWHWVLPYLQTKYAARSRGDNAGPNRTLVIYQRHWDNVAPFLAEKKITAPALLEREHAYEYVRWRTSQVKEKSKKHPGLNMALEELKFFGAIIDEAVARSYCAANPIRKLGIKKEETELKPEITEEEQHKIEAALLTRPAWMRTAFTIAIATGLRFRDTRLARHQINWKDNQLVIERPKGGRKREFAIPIYEPIRCLLQEFWNSKEAYIWTLSPKEDEITGLLWHQFFQEIGLPHLCFHSTRVSFITRGMRAGIPETVMCRMVNHASKLINRIYQRWTHEDVRAFAAMIPNLSAVASKSGSPQR